MLKMAPRRHPVVPKIKKDTLRRCFFYSAYCWIKSASNWYLIFIIMSIIMYNDRTTMGRTWFHGLQGYLNWYPLTILPNSLHVACLDLTIDELISSWQSVSALPLIQHQNTFVPLDWGMTSCASRSVDTCPSTMIKYTDWNGRWNLPEQHSPSTGTLLNNFFGNN